MESTAVQRFVVPEGSGRRRADKVLATAFPEHSRVAFQRAFDAGRVRLADRPIGRDQTVVAGELLTFSFPEVRPAELRAVEMALEVLFEDRHLLALNKPSGLVVHPGAGTGENTLVHALLAHCRGSLSGIGGVERPGIVHRLDRETSGVILVAKTDAAHRGLAEQFASRSLAKEYLALVSGVPSLLSGTIRRSVGRHPQQRHKMTTFEPGQGGREARTDWQVVEAFPPRASLLRCVLHTGRTHQIRVHLKSLGHVILGDGVYGWRKEAVLPRVPARVMLHAERLALKHPVTGKALNLRAPLPADFAAVLDGLRRETDARRS